MTLEEKFKRGREEGRKEGLEEGRREGLEEGRREGSERVNKLNSLLAEAGRLDDILNSANDAELQQRLFEEFDL